jgi:aryl sulfotransferase
VTRTAHRPDNFDAFVQAMRTLFTPAALRRATVFKARPTDVFIVPYRKCGTTWIQQIVHSLRTGGDLDFDDISRVVPWLETAVDLGIDLDAPQRAEPRAFKSHLPWRLVPKGGRYVVAFRDPKDTLVSAYRFFEGWFFEPGSVGIDELARGWFMQRGGMDYWSHLISWWQQRDNPDVLLLAYEHMKQDPNAAIRRIAALLDIPLDPPLLGVVAAESSLDSMLAHRDRYDDLLMRRHSEAAAGLPAGGDLAKVRKGVVGSHRAELPSNVAAELDAMWTDVITPVIGARDYSELLERLDER